MRRVVPARPALRRQAGAHVSRPDPYADRARAAHARGESLTIRQIRRLGLRLPPAAGPRWGGYTWPAHTLSRQRPR